MDSAGRQDANNIKPPGFFMAKIEDGQIGGKLFII